MQDLTQLIHPYILKMSGYTPGKQVDTCSIKLNTNENPFPPSKAVLTALRRALEQPSRLHLYPNSHSTPLRQTIAKHYGLSEAHVMIGNGSDELLNLVFRAVLSKKNALVVPKPSYSLYPILAQALNASVIEVPVQENWHVDFKKLHGLLGQKDGAGVPALFAFANPNAPTGLASEPKELLEFTAANPKLSLVDEAYAPFMQKSLAPQLRQESYHRLIVTGSFSKAYSLAGQRIGWMVAHPRLIEELDKLRDSYNVSYLAQVAALAAWNDPCVQKNIRLVSKYREKLTIALAKLGFHTLSSSANFIFTRPPQAAGVSFKARASHYTKFLEQRRIYIRYFPGLEPVSHYVRISIGTWKALECLLQATQEWLGVTEVHSD